MKKTPAAAASSAIHPAGVTLPSGAVSAFPFYLENDMSKQSHTPGPWEWSESYKTEDGRETFTLVCENYEYGILSCDGLGNSPQSLGPQGMADAKLIVAAPELLEACQAFKRLYGRLWDVVEPSGSGFLSPESVKEYDAIHELMTAAIAKATA